MAWFAWLEKNTTGHYRIIHMAAGWLYSFCEVFVTLTFCGLPMYRLWSFISFSRTKRIITAPVSSSSRAWRFSWSYPPCGPNGQHLRPAVMPRDNIFTRMVAALYRTDTPTNLWPSIHVYNSLAHTLPLSAANAFEKKKGIRIGSLILAVSIIMATMFIKQHSVFDVLTAFVMAAVMYTLVYRYDLLIAVREFRNKRKAKPQIG